MKKLTLIAVALAMTLSAGAQRKTWDFTKGFSAQTIAALQASVDANKTWSDYEKNATSPEGAGKYYMNRLAKVNGTACTYDADGNATAIPELEGLTFNDVKAKGLVLAYNYSQSENASSPNGLYTYGKSFMWLNGKNLSFSFRAPANTTLRLGIESHNNSEGRGFNVSVGSTRVTATSGNETPQFFNECVYDLPEATDGSDSLTVKIQSTNGAHLYYIIVGEGDEPQVEENKKIGYVYNPDVNPEATVTAAYLQGGTYDITSIPASATDVSLDSLQAFDALVIDNDVPADAAIVPTLKSAVAYEPIVNLDSKLYSAWGYGSEAAGNSASVNIKDANATLFKNWDGFDTEQTTLGILNEGSNVTGVKLGTYFAEDDTLATTGDAVAIHQHNPLRNTYIFLPYGGADLTEANQETFASLLPAAVKTAADTKVSVTKATKPSVKQIYKDQLTRVALSAQKGANIYYTTDGSEPTTSSAIYSDTLSFSAPVTLKAIATLDGYLTSDVLSQDIDIKAQAKTPVITVAQETGKSTVTITQADGVNIYYNFTGSSETTASALYTAPFELTENATVTAFAQGGAFVQSETTAKAVEILGQNAETMRTALLKNGHYNTSLWYDGSKAVYPFGGKNATSCYEDPETKVMKAYDTAEGKDHCNTVEGWQVTSRGQVVTFENTGFGTAVGDDGGYNPATVTDALPIETSNQQGTVEITKYATTFGAKLEGEPYTAAIRSKQAFQGPFDVVVYCANGNGTSAPEIGVKVSADETVADSLWTLLGDTIVENQARRTYKRSVLHYDGNDKVFVQVAQLGGGAKAMVADIYVLGTLSNADAIPTGIASVIASDDTTGTHPAAIYSINGTRLSSPQPGVNIIRYSNGKVRKVLVK